MTKRLASYDSHTNEDGGSTHNYHTDEGRHIRLTIAKTQPRVTVQKVAEDGTAENLFAIHCTEDEVLDQAACVNYYLQ